MPKRHLLRLAAERQPDQLVPEANPQHRYARCGDPPNDRWRVRNGRGIAGTIRQEDAIRVHRQHRLRGCVGRYHRHSAAIRREEAQNVALDAVVVCDDVRWSSSVSPLVRLSRRHHRREIQSLHRRTSLQCRNYFGRRQFPGRDHTPHYPGGPQVFREPACVNIRQHRHLAACKPASKVSRRPPVGIALGELSHDHAGHLRTRRLRVVRVDAVVADHRRREHDDLAAIGGVGEHLLVAGHVRREHDLGDGWHHVAAHAPVKKGSILEEEEPWAIARRRHA